MRQNNDTLMNNMNNDKTLSQYYDNFYLSSDFKERKLSEKSFIKALIKKYNLSPGLSCLDVGSGTGKYSKLLVDYGLKVTGIDVSRVAIEKARNRCPKASFLCKDIKDYSPSHKFDIIFCSGFSLYNSENLNNITRI